MDTIEIPRTRWAETLDGFSLMHEGWLVSVEVTSPDFGAQPEIHDLPLVGITAEPAERGDIVAIAAARSANNHVTRIVHAPTHIWIERTEEGADAALEVESADRTKTILRFKTAARPDTVDSVVRG